MRKDQDELTEQESTSALTKWVNIFPFISFGLAIFYFPNSDCIFCPKLKQNDLDTVRLDETKRF